MNIKYEIQNLTVKETEEAKEYDLSLEQYVTLRQKILDKARPGIEKEVTPTIESQVEYRLKKDAAFRKKLVEEETSKFESELRPVMEKEITIRLNEKLQSELKEKIRKDVILELDSEKIDEDTRASYASYLRELELEVRTLAGLASQYAELQKKHQTQNVILRKIPAVVGAVSIIPLVVAILNGTLSLVPGCIYSVGIFVFCLWSIIRFVLVAGHNQELTQTFLELVPEYLKLADEIVYTRSITIRRGLFDSVARSEILKLLGMKNPINSKFSPIFRDIGETRKRVQVDMLSSTPIDDVLNYVESDYVRKLESTQSSEK